MSRRKKNNKKRQNSASPVVESPAALAEEVKSAIAQGRGHKALALLKNARKSNVQIDDRLVADAYMLRLREMLENGQLNEAKQMYRQTLLGYEFWNNAEFTSRRLETNMRLGFDQGWKDYEPGADASRIHDDVVFTKIESPNIIAAHPTISREHPLKIQASAIIEAWRTLDSGDGADMAQALGGIGRKSPLRGWRLFLEALKAYYEKDDDTAAKLCARIPDDAAVCRYAAALTSLLADPKSSTGENAICTDILERIQSFRVSALKQTLQDIDARLKTDRATTKVQALAVPLLQKLAAENKVLLACEIEKKLNGVNCETLAPLKRWNELCQLRRLDHEPSSFERLWGLEDYWDWNAEDVDDEENPLFDNDFEKAVYLNELVQTWLRVINMTMEFNDDVAPSCRFCSQSKKTWCPGDGEDIYEMCPDCMTALAQDICRQALECHPLENTCKLAASLAELHSEKLNRDKYIKTWLQHFPESIEAIEKSIWFYLEQNDLELAEKQMRELEKRRGTTSKTDETKFLIAVKRADSLCGNGRNVLAEVEETLAPCDCTQEWREILCNMLKLKACGRAKSQKKQFEKALLDFGRPLLVWHFATLFNLRAFMPKLPASMLKQLKDTITIFQDFTTIIDLPEQSWSTLDWNKTKKLLDKHLPEKLNIEQAKAMLPLWLHEQEQKFDYLLRHVYHPYLITAQFLGEKDEDAAVFWAWRAFVYVETSTSSLGGMIPQEAYECLAVAINKGIADPAVEKKLKSIDLDWEKAAGLAQSLEPSKMKRILRRERKYNSISYLYEIVIRCNELLVDRFEPPLPGDFDDSDDSDDDDYYDDESDLLSINSDSPLEVLARLSEDLADGIISDDDAALQFVELARRVGVKTKADLGQFQIMHAFFNVIEELQKPEDEFPQAVIRKAMKIIKKNPHGSDEETETIIVRLLIEHEIGKLKNDAKYTKKPKRDENQLEFDL